MAITLKQAIQPTRGSAPTSKEMVAFAEAINSRILTGAGDAHWRIPYYIFSAYFRKPRLDDGTLYTPESEFFDFYQFVNPSSGDSWPTTAPQSAEGANLQTNNLNKFIFGMNYQIKDDGYYVYDREDVRASKIQINLKSNPSNFRGFIFPYFNDVGISDVKEYSAFGFAYEYLSNGYINGNTVNPSGHSYGGYYGTIPTVIKEDGCGTDLETGIIYPSSIATIHEIDTKRSYGFITCPKGSADINDSYFNVFSYGKNFVVTDKNYNVYRNFSKNKHHLAQYNSHVYLGREIKNHLYRILNNYISFAKGFDLDWFFRNQYAYAPEIGSFGFATAYYLNDEETFTSLEEIAIASKRLNFNQSSLTSSSNEKLLINNVANQNDSWNLTIASDASIKKTIQDQTIPFETISGSNNILNFLAQKGFLDRTAGEIPTRLYSFPTSLDSVLVPQGFAFQSFQIQSTNLKSFAIEVEFYSGKNSISASSFLFKKTYSFDFGATINSSSQVIDQFISGGNTSLVFKIKNVVLRSAGTGAINLQPIFLFAYKPQIEDAYALLRAATYNGINDGDIDSSSHPFNMRVDSYDIEAKTNKTVYFCTRLSDNLKTYGYILSSSVNTPQSSHSNNNSELNTNAVFETARRLSLYTRIVKPDNYVSLEADNKTLKFSRYAKQNYTWGRLNSSTIKENKDVKVPYQKYVFLNISDTVSSGNTIVLPNQATIDGGLFNFLKYYLNVDGSNNKIIFQDPNNTLDDVNNPNFLCNYYTGIDIYDFQASSSLDILTDLDRTLVKGLTLNPATNSQISFSPLSFYGSYDFVVINANDVSSFIYYRFEQASGDNWNKADFISVKKYSCINGTHNPPSGDGTNEYFEWLGITNNDEGNYGIVEKTDLLKIGAIINPNTTSEKSNVFLLLLKRKFTSEKSLQSGKAALFGGSDLTSVNRYYFADKNYSLLYYDFPFEIRDEDNVVVTEPGAIYPYIEANISGFPILYNAAKSDGGIIRKIDYYELDAKLKYPESSDNGNNSRPISGITNGQTIPITGSIENFAAESASSSYNLTKGNKYRVSSGNIIFNGTVYLNGDIFIAGSDGTCSVQSGSPSVYESKAFKTKKIDFKLNECVIYTNGDEGSGSVSSDFSLRGLLNKLIASFRDANPAIYLNQTDGTFSASNPSYEYLTNGEYIPSDQLDLLTVYNKCLAGFPIKFSYLGNEKYDTNFENLFSKTVPPLSGPGVGGIVSRSSRDESNFWMAVYDSSNVLKSKIYFRYDETIILPALNTGEYLKFSIPINDRYIEQDFIDNGTNINNGSTLYAGNYYKLTSGKIKIDLGGGNYEYHDASDFPGGDIFISPVTGTVTADPSGSPFTLIRMIKNLPFFVNGSIYLSLVNYFYIDDLTYYFRSLNKSGSLAVARSVSVLQETQAKTELRDIFQDIVLDPDIPNSAEKNGIIEQALPKQFTNEWALWMNFIPYNASDTSPFKEEVYAATGSPFYDRCHINSAGIPKSKENLHLNLGLDLARYVEAPPSYRYMPLLNNKEQVFYENVIGSAGDPTQKIQFYKSCKGIVQPYKIKKAYYKTGDPNHVYIELDREIDGKNEPYRTDYNGLKDWEDRGVGFGKVAFKVGDASLTNQNGLNQIISHSSNQYKGSYYPRFFFLKLIPKPYDDDNSLLNTATDSFMSHEHVKQSELYIEAMREGFASNEYSLGNISCDKLGGHFTPPDYTYEQLFFNSTKYGENNGNKWPSLLTFSKSFNTLEIDNKLFGPLRNEDNPRGFGALPSLGTYAETFTSLVNAVNNLKSFRVSVPQEYFAQYYYYNSAISQNGSESDWELITRGTKSTWVKKTNSDNANNFPAPPVTQIVNLRRNDGTLSPIGVNRGYTIGHFGSDNAYASISSAYIIKNNSTASILVLPIDPELENNAYSIISEYINGVAAIPMTYQTSKDAGILTPAKEEIILDTCGFYYNIGGTYYRSTSQSQSTTPSCMIKTNLQLVAPDLFIGRPYFNAVSVRGCITTTKQGGQITEETIGFAGTNSNPLYITNFSSSSSASAQIFETSWRIITP